MSDERHRRLQMLEEDYKGQPLIVQQADLPEINRLRAELGMSLVDARLKEIVDESKTAPQQAQPKPARRDHSEARAIYAAYLKKQEELSAHRAYADLIARATSGSGQTPVYPLATMGTDGGPLLCDYCGKPIVLEGGQFHGMNADAAWAKHPTPTKSWTSYILGGLVVEIKGNGTLRIYHGYPGRQTKHCCNAVLERDKKARADYEQSKPVADQAMLMAFFEDDLPELTKEERYSLYSRIVNVMYSYDPGIGVNRPSKISSKG